MSETIERHEVHQPMFEIEGAPVVYILEGRIGSLERHDGLYYYDMRHGDTDWSVPVTIEKSVFVNFFGTLATTAPIKKLEAPNPDNDWIFIEVEADGELEELIIENRC